MVMRRLVARVGRRIVCPAGRVQGRQRRRVMRCRRRGRRGGLLESRQGRASRGAAVGDRGMRQTRGLGVLPRGRSLIVRRRRVVGRGVMRMLEVGRGAWRAQAEARGTRGRRRRDDGAQVVTPVAILAVVSRRGLQDGGAEVLWLVHRNGDGWGEGG
jgi:hypothetical protein